MMWEGLFHLLHGFFFDWTGSAVLSGVVFAILTIYALSKIGIGMEGAVLGGGAVLMVFAATLLPGGGGIVVLIAIVCMTLFAMGVLRVWRK